MWGGPDRPAPRFIFIVNRKKPKISVVTTKSCKQTIERMKVLVTPLCVRFFSFTDFNGETFNMYGAYVIYVTIETKKLTTKLLHLLVHHLTIAVSLAVKQI